MIIWLNEIKKQNIVTVPCSSRKCQILTIIFTQQLQTVIEILTITWPTKK